MKPQTENQVVDEQVSENSLPDIFDILSGVGLLGGVVGSALNNIALAGIPVSIALALQIVNRRQLGIKNSQIQQAAIAQLSQEINNNQSILSEEIQQLQQETDARLDKQSQSFDNQIQELSETLEEKLTINIKDVKALVNALTGKHNELDQFTHILEKEQQHLKGVVNELHHIESISQQISMNADQVDAYYQRGLSFQKLGDKVAAIKNYTEALHLDPTYAQAYHNRGIILAELGNRKQAVEDLRLAAKYYFEQEDLNSYRQARELSKEFYDLRYSLPDDEIALDLLSNAHQPKEEDNNQADIHVTEAISVGNLFS